MLAISSFIQSMLNGILVKVLFFQIPEQVVEKVRQTSKFFCFFRFQVLSIHFAATLLRLTTSVVTVTID